MIVARKMSVAKFERVSASLGTCELDRGQVAPLSASGFRHNRSAMNLAFLLETWARKRRCGRVVTNEIGIVTERKPGTVRGADVAYISYVRMPRDQEPRGFLRVPPELVIEVVGERQSWKRVVTKAGEYFKLGVDRVWVIDPDKRRVFAYRADAEPLIWDGKARVADAQILPGFQCKLGDIFDA